MGVDALLNVPDNLSNLLGTLVMLAGPLMTGFCLYEGLKSLRLVTRGATAKGTITAIRWGMRRGGGQIAYPTVEFITANKQRITHVSQSAVHPAPGKIGDTIQVRYLPGMPHVCSIDTFAHLWFGPLILGTIGIPWTLYGIASLIA
jgi:hypothetical protein